MFKGQIIALDYPVNPVPRYGFGKAPHPELTKILEQNNSLYEENLLQFLQFREDYLEIPIGQNIEQPTQPAWYNGWLPGLDSVALYGFLARYQPKRYFEIGSGNSTKFARRAIIDHNLNTKITSFDPEPRAEIDAICDQVVRQPVEEVDATIFQELEAGDILFVDNSHRSFMNSDVSVVFLELLPRLRSGVLVEFHDILLPYDYPPEWGNRFYNEQYLLACYLLAEGKKFEVILPNYFISRHDHLSKVLSPLWDDPRMKGAETHGCSFWLRIK